MADTAKKAKCKAAARDSEAVQNEGAAAEVEAAGGAAGRAKAGRITRKVIANISGGRGVSSNEVENLAIDFS